MPLDWDVLLDGVSIKSRISGFTIRESQGAYARELTLSAADPLFYDQFDCTTIPLLRIEIKTKSADTWISQGKFYIERNTIFATQDSILSPGVWGRSQTAKAGQPFAQKISKTWSQNTTCQDIVQEMADLCGLAVSFEITNYVIFANTYTVDGVYPIDVIEELAGFAGAHVGCTKAGALVVKPEIFHPAAADFTITDPDIIDISEQLEYPEFGNRIRISALGGGAGNNVTLEALNDDDCLPADGTSKGTLLAFVTGNDGEPAPDNTIVAWTKKEGVTLDEEYTGTGNYLLENRKHRASNYYTVEVDFPIALVIGIWAYADAYHSKNLWDDAYGSFAGRTITVGKAFAFCDQMLKIAYITSGCAANKVTAGSTARDVEVTADVDGASDTIIIKQGNTCACGSSLNAKVNPYGDICMGNLAHILVWATINNTPASGYKVQLRLTSGCGRLSSENKKLKTARILNEAGYARNTITGVSRVETKINPAAATNPAVYLKSDTGKAVNLYSSHDGKIIDLTTAQATGQEVVIDYYADGATLVSWRTLGVTKDCDAEITIKMADGTEAGLREVVNLSAKDCSEPAEIPEHDEDRDEYDPSYDDQNSDEGGFEDDGNDADPGPSGEAVLTPCDTAILNRIMNADDAASDEERDEYRFGTGSSANCPGEGEDWGCPCSDMCESEIQSNGGTYDYLLTIHEQVSETYEKGTPEYNEAFETLKQTHQSTCTQNCETARQELCGNCEVVSGPESLAPGETAEYVCSDGASALYTMPEDACGTHTFTIGCCSIDVRSTLGQWVLIDSYEAGEFCGWSGLECTYNVTDRRYKNVGENACVNKPGMHASTGLCVPPSCDEATGSEWTTGPTYNCYNYKYEWQCL